MLHIFNFKQENENSEFLLPFIMHFTNELFLFSNMSAEEMASASSDTSLKLLRYAQTMTDKLSLLNATPYQNLFKQQLFQTKEEAMNIAKEWMLWFYQSYPDKPFQVALTQVHTRSVSAWFESVVRHNNGRVIIPPMEWYNQKMREDIGATNDITIKHTYENPPKSAKNAILRCFITFPSVILVESSYDIINKKIRARPGSVWISETIRENFIEVGNLTLAKEIAFKQIIPQNKKTTKYKL